MRTPNVESPLLARTSSTFAPHAVLNVDPALREATGSTFIEGGVTGGVGALSAAHGNRRCRQADDGSATRR